VVVVAVMRPVEMLKVVLVKQAVVTGLLEKRHPLWLLLVRQIKALVAVAALE
jgi:hypothetical protein